MKFGRTLFASLVATTLGAQQQSAAPRIVYPATRTVDTVTNYFGTRVPDPYRWMEAIETPEVAEWIRTENAITMPYLASLRSRDVFQTRITSLYNYARTGIPFWEGGRWYYSKNSGLQKQNVWYSRGMEGDTAERVVIDANALSPDGSVALSSFSPSPNGRWLAYGQSQGGSDWVTLYVRDQRTGRNTADTVKWVKFSGVSWTGDGGGFFYSRYPTPPVGEELKAKLEGQSLYYHRIGTSQDLDMRIYARPDEPTWFVFGGTDETGRYLFISTSRGTDKNELYMADLGDGPSPKLTAPIVPIVTGHDANYDALGVANGRVFIRTDNAAPNRRIVSTPVSAPDPSHWTTIVPEGDQPIESAGLIAGRIGVVTLEDVASVLRLYTLDGQLDRTIATPGLGTATGLAGRYDRPEIYYGFTSPTQPTTVYAYDLRTSKSTAFQPPRLTFDPRQFVTERVFYVSRDSTRVPMFITHRRDLVKNGSNPTFLYAYGGFDITMQPSFSPSVIAWIEQGGVYALANLRGGGEYGERWHEAGMHEKKQNVFDDFIGAAQYLISEKYTSPEHLAINGGSNGGLLVGAVMTQRPDLFAAAIPQVGVMDMLRYDRFTGGAAWAVEYGSSSDSTAFQYLRAYSPLQNIRAGTCYPATLVTTADHDDRVVPSHSFKFAATLQKAQACARPVLIRVEAQGSHGYRPLDRRIAESADIFGFAAQHTGMTVKPPPITP